MLFTDTYKTIVDKSQGEFKDKGSKFIALAFEVNTEEEVKNILAEIKKEHYNAAHHCYAYILTPSKQIQKSNDDREPNNTAGKPILRAILSHNLTNTLVVVVRYFGGKLLGVPGLIQAYGEAATLMAVRPRGRLYRFIEAFAPDRQPQHERAHLQKRKTDGFPGYDCYIADRQFRIDARPPHRHRARPVLANAADQSQPRQR